MAMNTKDANLIPAGMFQTAALSTAVSAPSIPANARSCIFQAIDNDVSWRDDGNTATNSSGGSFGGMILAAGDSFHYIGSLEALSFIEATAASTAYINISYYK